MQQEQQRPLAFDYHPQGDAIGFDHAENALPHDDMLDQRSTAVWESMRSIPAFAVHIRAEVEPLPCGATE